jgi:hypothetical protein
MPFILLHADRTVLFNQIHVSSHYVLTTVCFIHSKYHVLSFGRLLTALQQLILILAEVSYYRLPDDSLTARPYSRLVLLRMYGMSL